MTQLRLALNIVSDNNPSKLMCINECVYYFSKYLPEPRIVDRSTSDRSVATGTTNQECHRMH
jgi:hypothetical protein